VFEEVFPLDNIKVPFYLWIFTREPLNLFTREGVAKLGV
jgi:hypothetical protein